MAYYIGIPKHYLVRYWVKTVHDIHLIKKGDIKKYTVQMWKAWQYESNQNMVVEIFQA